MGINHFNPHIKEIIPHKKHQRGKLEKFKSHILLNIDHLSLQLNIIIDINHLIQCQPL